MTNLIAIRPDTYINPNAIVRIQSCGKNNERTKIFFTDGREETVNMHHDTAARKISEGTNGNILNLSV